MAKETLPYEEFRRVLEEATWIADLMKTPGWKLLEKHMLEHSAQIEELLTQNKIRTVEETIQTQEGSKTYITSQESQIGENAGMYKMVKWILEDIRMILERPDAIQKAQRDGRISIQKAKKNANPTFHPFPKRIPELFLRLKEKLFDLAKEVRERANHQTSDGQSEEKVRS